MCLVSVPVITKSLTPSLRGECWVRGSCVVLLVVLLHENAPPKNGTKNLQNHCALPGRECTTTGIAAQILIVGA